jgi:ABC-type uncharacterized transport system YnjBCD permease subunit
MPRGLRPGLPDRPLGADGPLVSPALTGWERPPDALIVQDPWGLSLMAGLVIKEIPFLLLMSLAALPQLDPQRAWPWHARWATGRRWPG